MKIWFVDHPISQFKEDVKKLARQNQLKVVDSRFKSHYSADKHADDTPTLTKKGKATLKKEAKAIEQKASMPIQEEVKLEDGSI